MLWIIFRLLHFSVSGTRDAEVTESLKFEMNIFEIQTRDICTHFRGSQNCKDAWNKTLQKWLLIVAV